MSRINTVEMVILPKAIYKTPSKPNGILQNSISFRNRKVNPKVHMEAQKSLNSQSNPESKEQCWRYHNT
jgi:hypothetical protein